MTKPKLPLVEFLLGFAVGLVFSGVSVAILSELKYFVEHGKLSGKGEPIPLFDEGFLGDVIQPIGQVILGEIMGRVSAEEDAVKERRIFRESAEEGGVAGEGAESIYFEEE